MAADDDFVRAVSEGVAPLVDLLALVNDCAPLLGGPLAAQLDSLVRSRIALLVDGAAAVAAAAAFEEVTAGGPR